MAKEITYAEFESLYGYEALSMLQGYGTEFQKKILSLPQDQQNLWVIYRTELNRLFKRKYQLEDALDSSSLPPAEVIKANSSIEIYEKKIAELQDLEYQITADSKGSSAGGIKFPDRGARDGGVSIRPSNISDPVPAPARKRKV